MASSYLIGLDFGTESARGVLIEAGTGSLVASHTHAYRHGVMTRALAKGGALPPAYALQDAADYLEAAEIILDRLGRARTILGIGLGFTASSPLPARADGTPLSVGRPSEPHAYVKLWKHAAAQPYAQAINARGGDFLANFGGKVSGEWLLAKAAQVRAEAPAIWAEAERFIEAGDWLVWQLTGHEARSLDFAAYKAQFAQPAGYPAEAVPGLIERLGAPFPVGTPVGPLAAGWRERTGIAGAAIVAVAVIDSHVVLPAVGAVGPGTLVGALGTSAAYLLLDDDAGPLPAGIEGMAFGAALPELWCYEAGQAGFGDTLAWFVRTFPRAEALGPNLAAYNREAAMLAPGQNHLVALDWFSGNRVPFGDAGLSGLLAGLTLATSAADIYRALLEALCFGTRSIVDHLGAGGPSIERIVLTSGMARTNPLLIQIMADVLCRPVAVAILDHPTATGAAIHAAVASGVVSSFAEGAARFGVRDFRTFSPNQAHAGAYETLYRSYRDLAATTSVRDAMYGLNSLEGRAAAG